MECCVGVSTEIVLQIDKFYTVVKIVFQLTFQTGLDRSFLRFMTYVRMIYVNLSLAILVLLIILYLILLHSGFLSSTAVAMSQNLRNASNSRFGPS